MEEETASKGIPYQGVPIPFIAEPINIAKESNGKLKSIKFGDDGQLKECFLHKVEYQSRSWWKVDLLNIKQSNHRCGVPPPKPCKSCGGSDDDEKPQKDDYPCIIDKRDVYNRFKNDYINECNGGLGDSPDIEYSEIEQDFFQKDWQRMVPRNSNKERVVDGKIHTCNGNENVYESEKSYVLDFTETFSIRKIEIFTKKMFENSLSDLKVELDGQALKEEDLIDTTVSNQKESSSVKYQKLMYDGDLTKRAKRVKISRKDGKKLVLCEIEVYGQPMGQDLSEGTAHFDDEKVLLSNIGLEHEITKVVVSNIGEINEVKLQIFPSNFDEDPSVEFEQQKSIDGEVVFDLQGDLFDGNIIEIKVDDEKASFPLDANVQIIGNDDFDPEYYVWGHDGSYAKVLPSTSEVSFSKISKQNIAPAAISLHDKCFAYTQNLDDGENDETTLLKLYFSETDTFIFERTLQRKRAHGFAVYYDEECTVAFSVPQGVEVATLIQTQTDGGTYSPVSIYIPIPMDASGETFGHQIAFADGGTVLMIGDQDAEGLTPLGTNLPGAGALHFYHKKDNDWVKIEENIYGLNSEFNFGSHGIFIGHNQNTLTLEVTAKDTLNDVEMHHLTAKCHVPHSVAKSLARNDPFQLECLCKNGFLSSTGGNKLDKVDSFCTPCSHSSYIRITHESITLMLPKSHYEISDTTESQFEEPQFEEPLVKLYHHPDEVKTEINIAEVLFTKYESPVGDYTFVFSELDPSAQYSIDFQLPNTINEPSFHSCSVVTSCSCSSTNNATGVVETTGRPTHFEVFQDLGHVSFSFIDNSLCDEAYSFERFDDVNEFMSPFVGKGISFTDDYIHTSENDCGEF